MVRHVVKCMEYLQNDADVLISACRLLDRLSVNGWLIIVAYYAASRHLYAANKQVILMPAAIPVVIAAMQAFPDEIDVQRHACSALATFADNSLQMSSAY